LGLPSSHTPLFANPAHELSQTDLTAPNAGSEPPSDWLDWLLVLLLLLPATWS